MKLCVNDLLGHANCVHKSIDGSTLISCSDPFRSITYEFNSEKIYGIVSDFSDGCWGLVYTLAGYGEIMDGNISIDNSTVSEEQLKYFSCLVGEPLPSKYLRISTDKIIRKFIKTANIDENSSELQQIFLLSKERFNRPIAYTEVEIWKISLLYGYLTRKRIFCFPWMSEGRLYEIDCYQSILEFLKRKDGIIFIPTSHYDAVYKYCDKIIDWRLSTLKKNLILGNYEPFKYYDPGYEIRM